MNWDLEAERELWADICRDSFWWFLSEAIGLGRYPARDGGPNQWFQEYIHRPIADWFQHQVECWVASSRERKPKQRHVMVVVPREFAKTTVITQAGMLWLHLQDRNAATYVGSETLALATTFLDTISTIICGEDPYSHFCWLYGNWYNKDRVWRRDEIVHGARIALARKEPSFRVWGVETGLTGTHPDALFFDDPISYDRMQSDTNWLDKVNSHVATLVPVPRPDGLIVWVGTRYGDGDHIGVALKKHKIASLAGMPMPNPAGAAGHATVTEGGRWHVYWMSVKDRDGNLTFPEQWSEERIKGFEDESPNKAAAQLYNNPSSSTHNPLTRNDIERCWVEHKDVPWNLLRFTMHVDTAFKVISRKDRGDSSVIQIWGHHIGTGNVYYIEGYGSSKWKGEDFYKHVTLLLQKYEKQRRRIMAYTDDREIGGKEGELERTLYTECASRNVSMPQVFLLTRGGKKKEVRHHEAAGYWYNGFVKLIRGAPNVDQLIQQMINIGYNQYDDWIDPASDVFYPKIYAPMRRSIEDTQPLLVRPLDDELQPGNITDEQAVKLYDRYHQRRNLPKFGRVPISDLD